MVSNYLSSLESYLPLERVNIETDDKLITATYFPSLLITPWVKGILLYKNVVFSESEKSIQRYINFSKYYICLHILNIDFLAVLDTKEPKLAVTIVH